MKKLLNTINTNKSAKFILLGGVVVIVAVIVLLVIAPWKSETPPPPVEETPVIQETPPPTDAPVETLPPADVTETPEPEPTPPPPPANPLTGISVNAAGETWTEEMSRNRPFAVAIGNTDMGVSLRGIGDADILCEYVNYSHGVTRFMAIYQEVAHVPYIRGIRSLRTWSLEIANGYDAIFVTWGGLAYKNFHESIQVFGNPITPFGTIDAASIGIRMDEDILPGGRNLENRAAVTGERLVNCLPDNFRALHEEGYKQGLNFVDDGTPDNGIVAEKFTVSFATFSTKKTEFVYNASESVYNARQYDRDLIDLNTNDKLSFTNVIVMQMRMKTNINGAGHVSIDTVDEMSPAYYFNGGKCIEVRWGRSDVNDPFEYFNLDGTPLEIGAGKTYICVVDLKDDFEPVSFE